MNLMNLLYRFILSSKSQRLVVSDMFWNGPGLEQIVTDQISLKIILEKHIETPWNLLDFVGTWRSFSQMMRMTSKKNPDFHNSNWILFQFEVGNNCLHLLDHSPSSRRLGNVGIAMGVLDPASPPWMRRCARGLEALHFGRLTTVAGRPLACRWLEVGLTIRKAPSDK